MIKKIILLQPLMSILALLGNPLKPSTIGRALPVRGLFLLAIGALALGTGARAYSPDFSTAGFYQTEASVREAVNFNIGWRFIKRDVEGAERVGFEDADWSVVNLPHGMELLPLTASGGVNYQGPSWYRKHFTADASLKGRKVVIHFEGIMGKSRIWINGKLISEHFGGYFPVHLDVTEYLKYGEENLIAVRADNSNDPDYPPGKPQEELDFTYFGGIYRDVWLITHNDVYVTHPLAVDKVAGGGLFVHYEDLSEKSVRVLVDTDVANDGEARDVLVHLELRDKNGNNSAESEVSVALPAGQSKTVSQEFLVEQPRLWRPDSPHLYSLHVTLKDNSGQVLDSFRQRIGIRTIEMRGPEGLYLNGKPYPQKLIGANRHQDFAHIGHALPNNLHYRDALKLRQAGMRVIRSAHYIQDPAFMDACDELGLFIVVTIPGWQFWNENPIFMKRMIHDVRKLLRLERNRPSVLLWETIPNETNFPDAYAIAANEAASQEYPYPGLYTATDARTHRTKSQKYFDVLYSDDIVSAHKQKSVFKREWGDFVDNWVDHNSVSRVAKQWGELPQLRQAMHYFKEEWIVDGERQAWPSLTHTLGASKSLIGGTLWHSFDHQRGYHPDPFWGGIMDAYRQPKVSYYLFKSLLPTTGLDDVPMVKAEPFVFVAHLLTPFSPEDVVVFTNCEEVRLTMFGKEIGVKPATDLTSPVSRVPVVFENVFRYVDARNYNEKTFEKNDQGFAETVVMKAEGLIGGKVVAEHNRWPVGRRRSLVLKVDDSGIDPVADGSDITPVVAYLVDAAGGVKRLGDEYVRFTVEGAGELVEGDGSEINPQKLLWGEAVALVRSGEAPGQITVRAEVLMDGLNMPDSAELTFITRAPDHALLYSEKPGRGRAEPQNIAPVEESTRIKELQEALRKAQRELQEYRLDEVARQQQEFIQ